MSAPELITERLRLRPLRAVDLPVLHRHWTEPEVRRFLWDGETISAEQVRRAIESSGRLFREHGVGLWGLRPHDSAELLGCAGYWPFHEPPQLELLISLSPSHWRRGLAREAAQALLRYAFEELRWPEVQASADAPNEDSLGLMRRLGMRPGGSVPGAFGTIEIYRISSEEWRRRPSA